MGNIETTTKFSILKNISSIKDNYLKATTGSLPLKKLFLNVLQNSQENNCVGVSF